MFDVLSQNTRDRRDLSYMIVPLDDNFRASLKRPNHLQQRPLTVSYSNYRTLCEKEAPMTSWYSKNLRRQETEFFRETQQCMSKTDFKLNRKLQIK